MKVTAVAPTGRCPFTGVHSFRASLSSRQPAQPVASIAAAWSNAEEDQSAKRKPQRSPRKFTEESLRRRTPEPGVRRWADPAFRSDGTSARSATPPPAWNRGRKLSSETRAKMRAAKLGRKHSHATVVRMSAAASGRTHHPSTISKIAASKRGTALTASHRAAISMAQKKRHAARRVLTAVEAVHSSLGGTRVVKLSAALCRARPGVARNHGTSTLEEVQNEYMMQLREFRSLQAELKPWIDAFTMRHARPPTTDDARATGIDLIVSSFHQYASLKDALLVEIPAMRASMAEATERNAPSTSKRRLAAKMARRTNSNATAPRGALDAASRMQAAQDYKRVQDGEAEAARTAAAAASAAEQSVAAAGAAAPAAAGAVKPVRRAPGPDARVQAALQKAMRYKAQSGAAKAGGAAVPPPPRAPSQSAILMTPVVGKTINGVDYASSDATSARAGQSEFVQQGSMPVRSYRNPRDLDASLLSEGPSSQPDPAQAAAAAPGAAAGTQAPTGLGAASAAAAASVRNGPVQGSAGIDAQDGLPSASAAEAQSVSTAQARSTLPSSPEAGPGAGSAAQQPRGDGSQAGSTEAAAAGSENGSSGSRTASAASRPVADEDRAPGDSAEGSGRGESRASRTAGLTTMLLDLRSKQAAATVAMAHAAAVAAVQQPDPGHRRAGLLAAADGAGDSEVESARAAARQTQQDFEAARLAVKLAFSETASNRAAGVN